MPISVCIATRTLQYPQGGGHRWVYLNWALGLRALGCEVIWLEGTVEHNAPARLDAKIAALKAHLEPFGLADRVAIGWNGDKIGVQETGCLDLDAVAEADLLLNLRYGMPPEVVACFRRTALVDIDPGLLQLWLSAGKIRLPPHDVYFTTGETVGSVRALFPDAGLRWHYAPPCVAVDWWPVSAAPAAAPFTTVSHWYTGEWMGDGDEAYSNDKRTGFVPFLALPRYANQPLELALCFGSEGPSEKGMLGERGWRVRDAWEVTSTPVAYQRYIQTSYGEFSCVKPSCVRLQNAWISDRTLCYLASGKPAVVQHTGPSRFLPEDEGLLRFRTLDEAVRALASVEADYERHSTRARALAEEHFDAKKVVGSVLERALR
jgi:hypothetical protein